MQTATDVLDYWLRDLGEPGWYAGGAAVDDAIRSRFLTTWQAARGGDLRDWAVTPQGTLAFLILTDQMPRNMFREHADAFATDALARMAAHRALQHDWDLRLPEPERQFFYLPFEHAENPVDQDRAVRLMLTRLPDTGADNLLHARAHRAVIRRFGRFPTRNAALGRVSTAAEQAYLDAGGYAAIVAELRAAA